MDLAVDFHPLSIPISFIDVESDRKDTIIIAHSPLSGYSLDRVADEISIWKEKFSRLHRNGSGFSTGTSADVKKSKSSAYDRDDIYDL